MNIYFHELKYNLKSALLWLLVLMGLVALMMCFFPAIKSDIDNFTKLLEGYPPAVKAMIGVAAQSLSDPLGYFCFTLTYVSMFAAVQAANLGVGIVSKELRDKTADFLMTKPVSRNTIITAKLLSALTVFLFTNVVLISESAALVYGMADGVSIDSKKFFLISITLLFLQIVFFAVGFIISVAAKKIKSVLPVSLGLVLLFFAISAFAVTASDDKLRFLTPFQYFKAEYIYQNGSYEAPYIITGLGVTAISILAGYIIYKRKDVHAV